MMKALTSKSSANLTELIPIEKARSRWPGILGSALTLLMIGGVLFEVFGKGLGALSHQLPTNPLFYLAFIPFYCGPTLFDYSIFRRLWQIPLPGVLALHRKRIANDALVGYLGEAWFYTWARQRIHMVTAPFGAVKDVAILSAIAGNSITVALAVAALPFSQQIFTPPQFRMMLGAVAAVVLLSLPFLLFSRRVFSLPRRQLWWIFGVHCLRILLDLLLCSLVWYLAMPEKPIGIWLLLCAGRMLISRLPFLPGKDLLFTNFIIWISPDTALSGLMALTASITLLAHAVSLGGIGLYSLGSSLEKQPS